MSKDTSSQEYLDLKTELRSLLISSQQGCNIQQLIRDYAAYNGRKEIPFRDMGYKSLIELITSMPDVARIDQTRTPVIIHGVADQNTVHIKKFVMTQKRKKNTRNIRNVPNRNNSSMYSRNRQTSSYYGNSGVPFQPYTQITNIHNTQWDSPNQQYSTISYAAPPVINNNYSVQNENIVTNKSSGIKQVASFPPKLSSPPTDLMSVRTTPPIDDNSSIMEEDITYSEDDELSAYDAQRANEHGEKIILLRKHIRQLLLKFPSGLWLTSVHKLYKKEFNEELNLEEFKLKNLMTFFDCVSDFVDSLRDRLPDSTNRLLLLKPNFVEAAKREQLTLGQTESTNPSSNLNDNQSIMSTEQPSIRLTTNGFEQPIVDLSSFVSLDFHYKRVECNSNEPFGGFLGEVEDPWNIHIGNVQFIPKRDRMMVELQDHYNQSSNQSIYVIPFEQIQLNLSCVYYHTDKTYYRAFILQIDPIGNNDIVTLKVYLVDYGFIISDINYHINSTNLKFLHKNFAQLSTQIYNCRLANVQYPVTSIQWPDDTRQFITDCCQDKDFSVEIVGMMDSLYCIYIWIDQRSINQLLIQHGFAIEYDDLQNSDFQPISSKISSINQSNTYIDERLLRQKENNLEYNLEENSFKHFIISIEHAFYFIKHPYTKRPCLPCFEVAKLLNKDETFVSQLNLIRETEVHLSESNKTLFNDLRCLSESHKCPHLNRPDDTAMIKLYDLSSIRDYLCKIKFKEGDVIDAFRQEYDSYERPGYWNEKKNSYISKDNLETHQDDLYQRRDLLNYRRDQLVSLSKTHDNPSPGNEMQTIDQKLKTINQELHTMETILPSTTDNHSTHNSSSMKSKSSNNKMRDTLYRIARPFDQQFSLNIRFNHQLITDEILNDDDIEERFQDLHRITKNVTQFFTLESEISDDEHRNLLDKVIKVSPDLITNNISLNERIEIYNYCLQIIEYFQPTIRYHIQRTDLIDTIY